MRKPVSETTKAALARALDWDLPMFDKEIIAARKRTRSSRGTRRRDRNAWAAGGRKACDFMVSRVHSELDEIAKGLQNLSRKLDLLVRKLDVH